MALETTNLENAKKALDEATDRHNAALNRESEARRDATATLNALNDAQRKFDAAVEAIRGQAPRGTDWTSKKAPAPPRETDLSSGPS